MFYISRIDGQQTPFDTELFRQINGQQPNSENTAGLELNKENGIGTISTETKPSAASVGLAGSSAQYNSKRAPATNEEVAADQQLKEVSPTGSADRRKQRTVEDKYQKSLESQTEREPAIRSSQIMSSPVFTIQEDANLTEAKKLFGSHRFRHVPVVNQNEKLIGILSDRDFLSDRFESLKAKKVNEVMTISILTARPEATIRNIADVMFSERIGSMPIVDEEQNLLGIVTRSDILRTLVNTAPLQLWV